MGAGLWGPEDCSLGRRGPDGGAPGALDDPELRRDETVPPGGEELVFAAPPDGVYALYVHYFEDRGLGPARAEVQIVFDDASAPAFLGTAELMSQCALWHVGDVSFPDRRFVPSTDIQTMCP